MPQTDAQVLRVGVRELRQNLSRRPDRVKSDESLVVTERGREVARLTPSTPMHALYADIVEQFGGMPPTERFEDIADAIRRSGTPPLPAGTSEATPARVRREPFECRVLSVEPARRDESCWVGETRRRSAMRSPGSEGSCPAGCSGSSCAAPACVRGAASRRSGSSRACTPRKSTRRSSRPPRRFAPSTSRASTRSTCVTVARLAAAGISDTILTYDTDLQRAAPLHGLAVLMPT